MLCSYLQRSAAECMHVILQLQNRAGNLIPLMKLMASGMENIFEIYGSKYCRWTTFLWRIVLAHGGLHRGLLFCKGYVRQVLQLNGWGLPFNRTVPLNTRIDITSSNMNPVYIHIYTYIFLDGEYNLDGLLWYILPWVCETKCKEYIV